MTDHHIYPEVMATKRADIGPGAWSVIPTASQPYADMTNRQIAVPLGDETCSTCGQNHAEGIRLHELAHVTFTPKTWTQRAKRAKLDRLLVNAVEDARVTGRLAQAGITQPDPGCPATVAPMLDRIAKHGTAAELITALASAYSGRGMAPAATAWANTYTGPDAYRVQQAASYMDGMARPSYYPRPWKYTVQTACALQRLIDLATADRDAAAKRAAAERAAEAEVAKLTREAGKHGRIIPGLGDDVKDARVQWCQMTIETPPLTRPAKAEPSRRWTARDEGTVPTAVHRFATDGRVFKQRKHTGKGFALLIDCSGSMQFGPDELRQLLRDAPATTVALYSSDGVDHGVLRVVARNGRRADDHYIEAPSGGGNGVDGPALRWLIAQRGTPVWLCDGVVTGTADDIGPEIRRDARNVAKAGKVMRVATIGAAIAVTSGKQPYKPTPAPLLVTGHDDY